MSTQAPPDDAPAPRRDVGTKEQPPALGFRELLRWGWRQLTSMRTALVLLLLLAVASVPGSLVPQQDVNPLAVTQWREAHPELAEIYDALGLFSAYDTAWFAAIYLLLMVSLVGCIIPRSLVYWRSLRAAPPPAPRHLSRLGGHQSYTTSEAPELVLTRARTVLRRRRCRVSSRSDAVSAERGYLREAGNLVFHLSVIAVLVGVALGSLMGFRGSVIVTVGTGFANNLTQYDDFDPGPFFDSDGMQPFAFKVTDFDATWVMEGPGAGMAKDFVADLTYTPEPGAPQRQYDLRVNHPLEIGEADIFLIGHGYAPVITIRDGKGNIAYSGATTFLPTNRKFRSFGVVKAPDAQPTSIGLKGEFYPSYGFTEKSGPFSWFGKTLNPAISMLVWKGDLGMNDGVPQSVYALDTSEATPVMAEDGSRFRLDMSPGQTVQLPGGIGSVTFEGVKKWVRLDIAHRPGKRLALAGVVLALLGLIGSLYVRPRRMWVRARRNDDGETVVEVAGLDRTSGLDRGTGKDVESELAAVVAGLQRREETDS